MAEQEPLTLVSFDLCPYVQRAAIALFEKNVPFTRINVDLADKPAWFKAISPLGKVPLLKIGDEVIFESSVILEYLEDTQPPPLHPADPLERARHRAFMEFGSSILADVWVVETTSDPATFDTRARLISEKFERVESTLGEGPFFAGSGFSLVDCVFAPIFRYFDVFERHVDLHAFDSTRKVARWRRALAERPCVRQAVAADYADRLERFLAAQNGVFTLRMRAPVSERVSA